MRTRNVARVWGIHLAADRGGIVLKLWQAFRGFSQHSSRANQLNRQNLVITLAAQGRPRELADRFARTIRDETSHPELARALQRKRGVTAWET